jgi:hypothetical protein
MKSYSERSSFFNVINFTISFNVFIFIVRFVIELSKLLTINL